MAVALRLLQALPETAAQILYLVLLLQPAAALAVKAFPRIMAVLLLMVLLVAAVAVVVVATLELLVLGQAAQRAKVKTAAMVDYLVVAVAVAQMRTEPLEVAALLVPEEAAFLQASLVLL